MSETTETTLTSRQRYWLEHVQACSASGKTIAAYALEQGLQAKTMYAGKKILVKKGVLPPTLKPRFQRVQVVEATLQQDPFSEQLFVFCNRKRDKIKILYWERNGFCLWQKRLERARFKWPRKQDTVEEAGTEETVTIPAHTRKKSGRRKLPESLPRLDVIHELPEAMRLCPHDGKVLNEINTVVSEQLDIVPAKIQVIRHIRKQYACECGQHIQTAPLPAQPIPKSLASPGLLAHITVSKYQDALPLYRQETILQRIGVELPGQPWPTGCSELARWYNRSLTFSATVC